MRVRTSRVLLLLSLASTSVACTAILGDFSVGGDDSSGGDSSAGGDGTLGDGGTTDGRGGDGSSSDGGADAAPPCGHASDACCAAPFVACVPGTACVSGTCKVNDLWVVGHHLDISTFHYVDDSMHYDGTTWTIGPTLGTDSSGASTYPTAIWGTSPGNYLVVTTQGKLIAYDASGNTWRSCGTGVDGLSGYPCNDPGTTQSLWAITGFAVDDYWLAGTNVMFYCTGASCTSKAAGMPASWGQGNLTGSSSNDLWYSASDNRPFHNDGGAWFRYPAEQARALAAISPTDVWGGDTQMEHFDGTSWSGPYVIHGDDGGAPGNVFAMSASATDDVWAVGYRNYSDGSNVAFSEHWDGASWTSHALPASAQQMSAVWAAGKKEAYAVSFSGGVFAWDGASWSAVSQPAFSAAPSWDAVGGSAR